MQMASNTVADTAVWGWVLSCTRVVGWIWRGACWGMFSGMQSLQGKTRVSGLMAVLCVLVAPDSTSQHDFQAQSGLHVVMLTCW